MYSDLNIQELFELRSKMILEGKSVNQLNYIIEMKEYEYSKSLFEDTASCVGGEVSGMGAVISPQASNLAGSTFGGDWSGNGGTIGSGDIGARGPVSQKPSIMGRSHGSMTGKKSRTKRLDIKALRDSFSKKKGTEGGKSSTKRVMNFNDFEKMNLDKVTKVNND